MERRSIHAEELTSDDAGGRIMPVPTDARRSVWSQGSVLRVLVFLHSFFLSLLLLLRRGGCRNPNPSKAAPPPSLSSRRRRAAEEEDDVRRRRALAEGLTMVERSDGGDGVSSCKSGTFLLAGARRDALFCRSWVPASGDMKGILVIIHGLNEHSGRYAHFANQLTSHNFGAYAMDWIGHGGSDGLHGYVPSLDYVVADTITFLEKIKIENPGVPCFLYGHSTGGAVVLKAALSLQIEDIFRGIVLTSPALRVKPAHPIVGVVAPLVSLALPKFQFKGANKRGIPVSRDPAAMMAKYSDPLVYTGPIRARTGYEILRISSYLMQNIQAVTVPFLALHGTADRVTDPLATEDLYNYATAKCKDIKLYQGFLHDLLFEPERDEVGADIIDWMEKRLL
ncbi:monoacylglycerol lipase-like [Phoenix dactylifera]|uniref:Monoacylglycerol lipase-like n=1 Tax=Phoenix dactylifera TaxID=42345 RepID=A0A8B7CR08_PHODC|nr:monoacylglycerol lipase-like [Phoenix dactylifera]